MSGDGGRDSGGGAAAGAVRIIGARFWGIGSPTIMSWLSKVSGSSAVSAATSMTGGDGCG
jgi:hypothetical protein